MFCVRMVVVYAARIAGTAHLPPRVLARIICSAYLVFTWRRVAGAPSLLVPKRLMNPPAPGIDPQTVRVIAAVVERDGLFLLCRRPLHKRHGGMWEFPGGKIEDEESDFDAARRELAEELGVTVLSVSPPRFSSADPGSHFLIEFMPVIISGSPQAIEHSEIRWASLPEMPHFDLAPSDRRFVEHLLTSDA